MFWVCLRYTKDKETAEDILQDGFIKVYQAIGKFKGTGSLEGWIRRIIVNTAIEFHRKHANMYPIENLDTVVNQDSGHDLISDISKKEILALIQALPPGFRTVFNLYAIEGFTHREIAEKLDISEGTSKSQLARARQKLQEKVHRLKKNTYGQAK